ncbi:MAG: efflux RND transporter periplasmic adaptor subunit, partial [Candidatus Baltobacteraceae bacterium]
AAASANGAASGIGVASANNAAEAAAIAAAKANVTKTQAALSLAELTASRDAALFSQGYVARSTLDTDRSTVAQDQSDIAAAQAAVAQAQAQDLAGSATVNQDASTAQSQVAATQAAQANVAAAEAVVRQDQLNLAHAVITSPVDGTVVARDVSVGQTVAASLQTPTLFSIAQNLAKMEIDINVAEPDIGNVAPGDRVAFSVLAHPNELFDGTVSQVRINPQTVNNVVTYDVVVLVRNANEKLLPGMTANATINVATAANALTVPLAALHGGAAASTPWGSTNGGSTSGASAAGSSATLFVARDGKPVPVNVRVTLTDGTRAAVLPIAPNALAAGDQVVVATNGSQRAARPTSGRYPTGGTPFGGGLGGVH